MTISKWIEKKKKIFKNQLKYIELLIFLSFVLKKDKIWIIVHDDFLLCKKEVKKLDNLVFRRIKGEPVAYLIKKKFFFSFFLEVSCDTLIPRPETEILVKQALLRIPKKRKFNILELGTGSGAIAIAIAFFRKKCTVIAIDSSYDALLIAKKNSNKLKLKNIRFFYSFWFSSIRKRFFDVIVSNPPYISKKEKKNLNKNILFEPKKALFSKKNGFYDLFYIVEKSKKYLKKNGFLLVEHGWNQKKKLLKFFKLQKYKGIKSFKDDGNHDRVMIGRK